MSVAGGKIIYNGTALIQAVGLVYQAASTTGVVSATLAAKAPGGLLQSLVPAHGSVHCTTPTTMSAVTPTLRAQAILLVASGIKNFKL